MGNNICLLILTVVMLIETPVLSQNDIKLKASKKDKCPVCGMFVYKYPDWICSIGFKDGTVLFFDGAKDLFKFYFDIKKYDSSKNNKDITSINVMEYYNMNYIKAETAIYIIGSDVLGPMGHELIAFENMEDAETFKKDHKGKRILTFSDLDKSAIKKLDAGH